MKTALSILFLCAFCLLSQAGEMLRYQNTFTTVFTNLLCSSNLTSSQTFTNYVDTSKTIYSTFVTSFTATGTNSMTNIWDRTIDGTTWIPIATNAATFGSNFEMTVTGKWQQYRVRSGVLGTNCTETVTHMGQSGQ